MSFGRGTIGFASVMALSVSGVCGMEQCLVVSSLYISGLPAAVMSLSLLEGTDFKNVEVESRGRSRFAFLWTSWILYNTLLITTQR